MKNKVIIVVWKWDMQWSKNSDSGITRKSEGKFCDFIGQNSRFEINVENKNCKFIGFTKYNRYFNDNNPVKPEYCEKDIIKEINKLKTCQVLLFLHEGTPDHFNKNENFAELNKREDVVVVFFSGGRGAIYNYLLGEDCFIESALKDKKDKDKIKIKQKNFDKIWAH